MALQIHHTRARELTWRHAAGMLFGDWGTSRLYVLGFAFFYSGTAAPYHVLAMCILLTAVAWAYTIVCRCFTDGGGVYSSAKATHQQLALLGAYLLFADYVITAALSAVEAFRYFGVSHNAAAFFAIAAIMAIGVVNFIGPRHAGRLAVYVAGATLLCILTIAAFCAPHLSFSNVSVDTRPVSTQWTSFVHIILALSGVEAIANMTGIMVQPVAKTSRRAIGLVLAEVVLFNLLFAVAMTTLPNLPHDIIGDRPAETLTHDDLAMRDTMVAVLANHFVGPLFAKVAAVVFGVLLLSAVNTAVADMINVQYAMARDEELPAAFVKLNMFGVPWVGLVVACGICTIVLLLQGDVEQLAHLYAIGVVGAITINLGSTCFNRHVDVKLWERIGLGVIALLLLGVEITIAVQKVHATIFAGSVIAGGYILRALVKRAPAYTPYIPKIAETMARWFEAPPLPEELAAINLPPFDPARPKILVASRGNPNLIRFAAEEAAQRNANLLVLFVREFAVGYGPAAVKAPELERDAEAVEVFNAARKAAVEKEIPLVSIYAVGRSIPDQILDFAGTYAVDFLILGISRRGALFRALRGDVITRVADHLPPETTLLIHA